jgi:hypothetical protein
MISPLIDTVLVALATHPFHALLIAVTLIHAARASFGTADRRPVVKRIRTGRFDAFSVKPATAGER